MKKEKIHSEEERQKPRIPSEGQKRIKGGGAHKNKKAYDRKNNKKEQREESDSSRIFLPARRSHILILAPYTNFVVV